MGVAWRFWMRIAGWLSVVNHGEYWIGLVLINVNGGWW